MGRAYECVVIISPDVDETALQEELAAIEKIIGKYSGTVLHKSMPNRMAIGYEIKKKKEGYVVVLDCDLAPEQITELTKALKLRELVLRHTIVVKKEKSAVTGL